MPRLLDLDDPRCADPRLAGGKAATLARARQSGLPVLPGVVVTVEESTEHIRVGVDALARRGSGGARLEVTATPLDESLEAQLRTLAGALGNTLVVRSSSVLEASAQWSGAFTSYMDVGPTEVAQAVKGCWASIFQVAALERMEASGVEPQNAKMAVLIQPALSPDFGGTAHLDGDDVVVVAIAGSPAPLVQGWEPGVRARVGQDGVAGESATELVGEPILAQIASLLREANHVLGSTGCEWAAVGEDVYLLQLITTDAPAIASPVLVVEPDDGALAVSRLARRFPGPLGEELVLPWALGALDTPLPDPSPADLDPSAALSEAVAGSVRLTSAVWDLPEDEACARAKAALGALRSLEVGRELLEGLRPPDLEEATRVLARLATVREAVAERGAVTWPEVAWHLDLETVRRALNGSIPKRQRIGLTRWDSFHAAVGISFGRDVSGVQCGPGVAFGRLRWLPRPDTFDTFRPREVIVAPQPTPNLASLLWDAAAVVTVGGGPAAHLFESARALGIPAVAGIHLEEALGMSLEEANGRFGLAVDGSSGTVFVSEW
ncbi:MAG TPA: PEP/pyruvate-binding domain-containing protein [Acidimicrobiia bacterium]